MSLGPSGQHALLGCNASDEQIYKLVGCGDVQPESIKAYTDIVYYNYPALGVSLQYKPKSGYTSPKVSPLERRNLNEQLLVLSAIDIYSGSYKRFPITLDLHDRPAGPAQSSSSVSSVELSSDTTGEQLVSALGEPDRKGGGESRSVGVWLEWTSAGIMCEFPNVHGMSKWDKANGAGSAKVGIWTFFEAVLPANSA